MVQKGWKHLFSLPLKKKQLWDLHNVKGKCASLHANFLGIHFIIASSGLLQSGEHDTKYLFFSSVHSFVNNLTM